MKTEQEQLVSLFEAHKISGYSVAHLRRLCVEGKLSALKIGKAWVVPKDAVVKFAETQLSLPPTLDEIAGTSASSYSKKQIVAALIVLTLVMLPAVSNVTQLGDQIGYLKSKTNGIISSTQNLVNQKAQEWLRKQLAKMGISNVILNGVKDLTWDSSAAPQNDNGGIVSGTRLDNRNTDPETSSGGSASQKRDPEINSGLRNQTGSVAGISISQEDIITSLRSVFSSGLPDDIKSALTGPAGPQGPIGLTSQYIPNTTAVFSMVVPAVASSNYNTGGGVLGGTAYGSSDQFTSRTVTVNGDITQTTGNTTINNITIAGSSSFTGSSTFANGLIVSSGNVGIGTTAPAQRLDVSGQTRIYDQTAVTGVSNLTIRAGAGQATGPTHLFDIFANDGTTSRFHVTDTGNIGIGTTGPNGKLEVRDTSDTWILGSYSAARAANNAVSFRAYDSVPQFIGETRFTSDNGTNNASTAHISVGTGTGASRETVTILTSGNVGIGTTAPTGKLDIAGTQALSWGQTTTALVRIGDVNGNNSLFFNTAGNAAYAAGLGITGVLENSRTSVVDIGAYGIYFSTGDPYGGALAFSTTKSLVKTERMRIDMNGNVGIGTTGPDYSLHVSHAGSSSAIDNVLRLENSTTPIANDAGVSQDYVLKDSVGARVVAGQINSAWSNYLSTSRTSYLAFLTRVDAGTITEKVRITGSGNVGIGTTGPEQLLHVNNTTASARIKISSGNNITEIVQAPGSGGAYWDNSSVGAPNYFRVSNASSNDTTAMTILSSGNVGIGTTGPGNKLVLQTGNSDGLVLQNASASARAKIWQDGGGNADLQLYDTSGNLDVLFDANSAGASYINAGNVGIGTTSPGQKLHLYNSGTLTLTQFEGASGTGGYIGGVNTAGNGFLTSSANDMMIRGEGSNILFGFSTAEKVRITNGGNVGIGTTSPVARLTVDSGATALMANFNNTAGGYVSFDKAGTSYGLIGNQDALTSNGGTGLALRSTGNMQFSTNNTSTTKMTLDTGGNLVLNVSSASIIFHGMPTAGTNNAVCYTATTDGYIGYCTSLRATKDNIVDLNLGLATLEQLRPVQFNWKNSGKADLGFVAEEVQTVNPLLASYDDNGNLIGVKYSQMTSLLVKAVQELNDKITVLETASGQLVQTENNNQLSVNSIASLSGKWSISEEGKLQAASVEVGTQDKPSGITLYDFTTKQPYCVIMNNGELEKHSGKCEDVLPTLAPPPPAPVEVIPEVIPEVTPAPVVEETPALPPAEEPITPPADVPAPDTAP